MDEHWPLTPSPDARRPSFENFSRPLTRNESVRSFYSSSSSVGLAGHHSPDFASEASFISNYLRPRTEPIPGQYFRSRRIEKGQRERPWEGRPNPREKWVTIIPLIGLFLGIATAAVLVWSGIASVVNHAYCIILDEDWSEGWNPKIWTQEVEVGGFGNGQFEETTGDNENAFVQDGMLYIRPSLQDPSLIENDGTLNLLTEGICTSTLWSDCVATTDLGNGTIINPVKSARINTKAGATIRYGRVEVVAQLPVGDWLWPAIWMLPSDSVYGPWPASGEIDIIESRGNNWTYAQGGNNIVSSTLHYGPNPSDDAWWRSSQKREALHTNYANAFHVFGLEWSEKYLFTYVDTRLLQILYNYFDTPLWNAAKFPPSDANGTKLVDPWPANDDSAPFDQDFYLILNIAVGGTNGWFKDGASGKPWVDGSPTAKFEFWQAKDDWFPTWRDSGQMVVKSVKMWQQSGYKGCNA